jgi:hypothetical protein
VDPNKSVRTFKSCERMENINVFERRFQKKIALQMHCRSVNATPGTISLTLPRPPTLTQAAAMAPIPPQLGRKYRVGKCSSALHHHSSSSQPPRVCNPQTLSSFGTPRISSLSSQMHVRSHNKPCTSTRTLIVHRRVYESVEQHNRWRSGHGTHAGSGQLLLEWQRRHEPRHADCNEP